MEFNGRKFKTTDELSGYEVGFLKGRKRVGSLFFDRRPPEHIELGSTRYADWIIGYQAGLLDRKYAKQTVIVFSTIDGEQKSLSYKGHKYGRGEILNDLEKRFKAIGDVTFYYIEKGKDDRVVNAGI